MIGDNLDVWSRIPEHERVVQIIREVGVWRLANFDGCICSRFSLRNVDVEIGCGRGGERGIWVTSPSFDYYDMDAKALDVSLLQPIADEVKHQVENRADMRGPISAHCCDRNPTGS